MTHNRTVDWLLPGVPPTGKKLSIPMIAVVNFRGDRIYNGQYSFDALSLALKLTPAHDFLYLKSIFLGTKPLPCVKLVFFRRTFLLPTPTQPSEVRRHHCFVCQSLEWNARTCLLIGRLERAMRCWNQNGVPNTVTSQGEECLSMR